MDEMWSQPREIPSLELRQILISVIKCHGISEATETKKDPHNLHHIQYLETVDKH
jgi:hypothetical protein